MSLTQSYLKSILHYSPETGVFTRLVRTANRTNAGDIAGSMCNGYKVIGVLGKQEKAHRLAFLYMLGEIPTGTVDHINGERTDNRWDNLRHVSQAVNSRNAKLRLDNTSGVPGVSWFKRTKQWYCTIKVNYKSIFLGYHNDKFEAICARKSAENRLGFHPNHGRSGVV